MKHTFFFLSFFLVLLSLQVVAVPITDLNISILNLPSPANKDLNVRGSWVGGDINVAYWQIGDDANIIIKGVRESSPSSWWWNIANNIYHFNSDVIDALGNNNGAWDGVADYNNGLWDTQAIGVNDSKDVNLGSAIIPGNADFSLFAFIKLDAFGDDRRIFSQYVAGNAGRFLFTVSSTGDLNVNIAGANFTTFTGTKLVTDTWYFVGLTRNTSTGIYTMYLNGLPVGTGGTSPALETDTPTFIGGINNASNMNGTIEEAMIFLNLQPDANVLDIYNTLAITTSVVIASPIYQTKNFSLPGTKKIQLTVQNVDGNVSQSLDVNVFGNLKITVWDENALTVISGASIDFNSGTYITDVNGQLNIPLEYSPTVNSNITIDVNSDFTQRTFVYDATDFSNLDLNLTMLETNKGNTIDFSIYQPDGITLFPANSVVEILRNDFPLNSLSARTKIPANQQTSIFLQSYALDYTMRITDSITGLIYDYNGTTVTVNNPKNEITGETITPWNLVIGGLTQFSFSNVSVAQTFTIFSDTINYYNLNVDVNTDFFSRHYAIKTLGGKSFLTVNPFLLSVATGSYVTLITQSGIREGISGITITLTKNIGGSIQEVESIITDVTGSAIASLNVGDSYAISFLYNGDIVGSSATFTPTVSPTYFYFNLTGEKITETSTMPSVVFSPGSDVILENVTDLNQLVRGADVDNAVAIFYQLDNGTKNILWSTWAICFTDCEISTPISVIGYDVNKVLYVDVNVFSAGSTVNTVFTKSYRATVLSTDLRQLFANARLSFGCSQEISLPCPWSTIVSIIITVLALGIIILKVGRTNLIGSAVLALLLLGFFAYVGWFYWVIYIIILIVLVLGLISKGVVS